jgi:hypothetical protein
MIYTNENNLPEIWLQTGDAVRNLMVLSYFAFASSLIYQGKVGTQIEGDVIVTWQELGESLTALKCARTESQVLLHVFRNLMWRRLYIDPNTGIFSIASDGNNFPLIQVPIRYERQDSEAIRALMQNADRPIPNLNDPANVDGISYVCAKDDTTVTHITMLWAYAHGTLVAQRQLRPTMHYVRNRYEYDSALDLLKDKLQIQYHGFSKFFNIVKIDTDGDLVDKAEDCFVDMLETDEAAPFVQSKIIPHASYDVTIYEPSIQISDPIEFSIPEISHIIEISAPIEYPTPKDSRKRKVFIIPLVLFLVIALLSNIFAWANIIAIAAAMTKIIISGVGSVIGLGCLVVAIALCCKDKVCDSFCQHSRVKNFSQDRKDDLDHLITQGNMQSLP